MSTTREIISSLRPYDFQQIRNSSDVTNSYIQHTLAEIDRIKFVVADKINDLTVYEGARKLLDENKGEKCFVFLGDNYFVERTVAEGKEILDRQLAEKKEIISFLESEKVTMEKRIRLLQSVHVNSDGHVEIHEKFEGPPKKNERRVARVPKSKVESTEESSKTSLLISSENLATSTPSDPTTTSDGNEKRNSENVTDAKANNNEIFAGAIRKKKAKDLTDPPDDDAMATKPKGISEKDFREFLHLVDEMMSDEETEEIDDTGDINYEEDADDASGVVKILDDEENEVEIGAENLEDGNLSEEKENSCTMKVANVNFGKKSAARKNAAKLIASREVEISSPPVASSSPSNANSSISLASTSTTSVNEVNANSTPTSTANIDNSGSPSASKKHVHFSENLVNFSTDHDAHAGGRTNERGDGAAQTASTPTTTTVEHATLSSSLDETVKSILRNKDEMSPINEPLMRKIEKKNAPKKVEPISSVIFSDEIVERNSGVGLAENAKESRNSTDAKPARDTTRNTRGMSKFKKSRLAAGKK